MSEDAAHMAVFISGTGHGIGCATAEKLLHYAASVGTPFLNRFINAKLTTKRKINL
ncbi:hypothetical protein AAFL42_09255 [Corynebacterium amycolatum]|uniref:hypothetical protein n=1 Tax=Corynebacterium TaxID=1716 RepID=UPI000AEC42AE|nr:MULTISPECIES: hypothetical protein [unclassified Corynebacterium]MBS5167532.1 hypothetical protein [Corynebacterium sp.]